MKKAMLSLRFKRICALYCESKDQVNLEQQFRRLGVESTFFTHFPDAGAFTGFDFVMFDGDHASVVNHGQELLWPEVPRIALVGTETPSRLQWIVDQQVSGYLRKPVRYEGVLSACVLALHSFEANQSLKQRIDQLEERVKARRFVVSAQLMLMRDRKLSEPDAYAMLRTLAMKRQVSLEQMSIELVASFHPAGHE